jgi:hypothetical protein
LYSYVDRLKAVNFYIKYDFSIAATVRELGYPSRSPPATPATELTHIATTPCLGGYFGARGKYFFEKGLDRAIITMRQ